MNHAGAVNAHDARGPGSARRDFLVILAFGTLLFFWRLGSHDLWPPDEPRFGLVAREMWSRGDYSVLSLNGRLYTDKPPLMFWAINGFGRLLGGVDEWAARLPSAVSGLLALLLLHRLGTWLYDRRTGLMGALVFATSLQILERARWASIDMTLNLFVLAAIVLLWRGRARPEVSIACNRLAWISMGLATLAKGPVGLVLPILAVLPWTLLERDFRAARRFFLPSGLVLYLVVTLSWFGLFAHRLGIDFALDVLVHQNVERYVDAWNAQHPVWFYLWRFPAGFVPWILFLPGAIADAFSAEEREHRSAARFLLTWIAAIVVFFSFSTGKRGVYIIPLYPAAAILVGRLMARATAPESASAPSAVASTAIGRLRLPLLLWSGVALLLALGLPLTAARRQPDLLPATCAIGGLLLAGAIAALLLHHRRHRSLAPVCLLGSILAVTLVTLETAVPWMNRHKNLRGCAEQVRSRLHPEIPFGTTEQKREVWVFYTGRTAEVMNTHEALIGYLSQDGPRDLLIEEEKLRDLGEGLPDGFAEVMRCRVGEEDFLLLRRGEASGRASPARRESAP
jgi:4-amino-4-deoxy-L-arabinose transferase-like glycosyltransferase